MTDPAPRPLHSPARVAFFTLLFLILGGSVVAAANPNVDAYRFGKAIGRFSVLAMAIAYGIQYLRIRRRARRARR
ncbi:MAG: hypothetical protein ACTHU0_32740 [Kofleriaceae bacterium]